MPRSRKSQSKHDAKVRSVANSLNRKGYEVKADVKGFSKPKTVRGFRPDIDAKSGKKRIIVEVETPDSKNSFRDKKQQQAFRSTAKQSKGTTFKRIVTK